MVVLPVTVYLVVQEVVALKRAYADVILNTMKESAGRVMVSEKRALVLQQELNATKENALCMLMRLKKMMDAKVLFAVINFVVLMVI